MGSGNSFSPDLTINDVAQNELNSGTSNFTFTVSLSAPAGTGGVTFDIATADGSAQDDNPAVTEDNDYVQKSLTSQVIPAGSTTYTFSVVVNGDLAIEPDETFFVNVTNVTGANVTDGQGLGTITNDDFCPAISWAAQTSGTTSQLLTVSAVSGQIAWAAGVGPTVRRTLDGGATWTSATGIGINGGVFNIYAVDGNTAFCTTTPGATFIYKTINGGTTWTQVFTQAGGFIDAIQMISPTEGYAVGDPVGGTWTILKTIDVGDTWARMATEPAQVGTEGGWNNSFLIIGTDIWFGTGNTRVYHSPDLGATWSFAATTGTLNTFAVHFNSTGASGLGLAGGSAMVKSIDGGTSYAATGAPGTTGNIDGLEGNEDTSSYRLELRDCKKPTPYCYNGIATVIMPSTGKITVWAIDLNTGSFDNCTAADKLKFSFSADVTQASREFSCADIPDGKSKTIPVDIWVTDEAGNQDHSNTYILLQDNSGNICPDVAGLSVTIGGKIQTETKEPVEHVRVNVYGGGLQMNYETGAGGTYHFEGLPSKSNYSLRSKRNDQPMNGVSTLDLVLIQKHILGIELLNSPYKILAADIDNDKQVTAIDLVELRKLILATYEDLPNNESWRFVPKSTSFADPQNPWNVSEVVEMKDVTTDHNAEDFIGIKVGDVNATAAPHSLMGVEVRGNQTGLLFEIEDRTFKSGEVVRVSFRSPNFRGISGWQGTLNVGDQLSAVSGQQSVISGLWSVISNPGVLNITDQNFGYRHAQKGLITMSWNSNIGVDIDDQQVLFTLTFKAKGNGRLSDILRIGSQLTKAESYEGKGEIENLSIRFVQNGNEVVAKSELYQNYPNPFDQRTMIGINLAAQGRGTLKVYDATGRTIKSVEKDWTRGYHEVWFDRKEIGATGVLYYRFESGFFNASKKMILID